jgi:hypothetical protein
MDSYIVNIIPTDIYKTEEVHHRGSLLHEMSSQERNQRTPKHHYEKWQACYVRNMFSLWN